jgi:hypothetical protein
VEHVSARPREGAVGAFAFGRSRGVIEGVLAAAGVPVTQRDACEATQRQRIQSESSRSSKNCWPAGIPKAPDAAVFLGEVNVVQGLEGQARLGSVDVQSA